MKLITLATMSALIALSVLGSASTLAAIPDLVVGGSGPSPSKVSQGDTVAFSVSLTNNDTSTTSQLYLTAVTDGPGATVYSTSTSACRSTTPLDCSWRNVKPGDTVSVLVVFTADLSSTATSCALSDGSRLPLTGAAGTLMCVDFVFSTTGSTPSDKGGTSHGDQFHWYDGVEVSTDVDDFRGRYVADAGLRIVENNQSINATNRQSTRAYSPANGIPVSVEDGLGANGSCNSVLIDCLDPDAVLWGEWSLVNVNDGLAIPGVTLYQFLIQFDASEIPSGVNANNIEIYHYWGSDGIYGGEEIISDRCSIVKSTGLPSSWPCLIGKKLSGGDLAVTIWTAHNGGMRGLK